MPDEAQPRNHHCRPERGVIEDTVYYSSKSASWVMTVIPTAGPLRQQRMDVRYCPWCGRDLSAVRPEEGATLVE